MLRFLKNALRRGRADERDQPSSRVLPTGVVDTQEDLFSLGNAAVKVGDFKAAAAHYARHLAGQPQEARGYIGLGFALSELGRWEEAIPVLGQAVAIDPQNADGLYMLGRAYLQLGMPEQAAQFWERAHTIAATFEPIYVDYCLLLFNLGKLPQALSLIKAGIALFPENSDFHFYYGNVLSAQGDFAAAVVAYQKAVSLGNSSPSMLCSFGSALIQVGNYDRAIDVLLKSKALSPDSALSASNYLLAIQYSAKFSGAEKFAAAKAFADHFEAPLMNQWGNYLRTGGRSERKLRIGYVSGDLRHHALAFFFEPIIALHDKSKFEVFCYHSHPVFDQVSQRIKDLADHWLTCHGMSDEALAARIRVDEIDVLVDLSGHTGHNRLLTFARKPAPVQMTWLGYMATTGLRAIDYRITDEALDPTGASEAFHSETLLRLSSSGTFSASPDSPPVNVLPALSGQPFTYGCLNNPSKITTEVIALWARILKGNPQARLMIGNATAALIEHLSAQFQQHGVDPDRLVFRAKVSLVEYFALHHHIDLALDTFPYNGGTTTFHSLWMGVPVLALEGNSTLSRVGTSVMRGMGLEHFCTETADRYVEQALYFAEHLGELSAVRASLRETMRRVTQEQALEVTRALESEMQSCWQKYCDKSQAQAA